jgi:hypothetical protein
VPAGRSELLQAVELGEAVDHHPADAELGGVAQLDLRLVVAVQQHAVHREAGTGGGV